MPQSLITRQFESPYLQIDEKDKTESFLFPSGTDREEIITTLEQYAAFRQFCRGHRYKLIGSALIDNIFIQKYDAIANKYVDFALRDVEVYL